MLPDAALGHVCAGVAGSPQPSEPSEQCGAHGHLAPRSGICDSMRLCRAPCLHSPLRPSDAGVVVAQSTGVCVHSRITRVRVHLLSSAASCAPALFMSFPGTLVCKTNNSLGRWPLACPVRASALMFAMLPDVGEHCFFFWNIAVLSCQIVRVERKHGIPAIDFFPQSECFWRTTREEFTHEIWFIGTSVTQICLTLKPDFPGLVADEA